MPDPIHPITAYGNNVFNANQLKAAGLSLRCANCNHWSRVPPRNPKRGKCFVLRFKDSQPITDSWDFCHYYTPNDDAARIIKTLELKET